MKIEVLQVTLLELLSRVLKNGVLAFNKDYNRIGCYYKLRKDGDDSIKDVVDMLLNSLDDSAVFQYEIEFNSDNIIVDSENGSVSFLGCSPKKSIEGIWLWDNCSNRKMMKSLDSKLVHWIIPM